MRNRGEGVTDERPTSTRAIVPRRRLLTRTVSFYGASSLSRNGGYDVQPVGGSSRQPFSSRHSHGNQCSYLTSSLCLLSSPVSNRIPQIHFGRPTLPHLPSVNHIYAGINTMPTALLADLVAVPLLLLSRQPQAREPMR